MPVKGYQRVIDGPAAAKRPARAHTPASTPNPVTTDAGSGHGFERIFTESVVCGVIVLDGNQIVRLSSAVIKMLGLENLKLPRPASILPQALRKFIQECSSRSEHEKEIRLSRTGARISVRAVSAPQKKRGATLILVLTQIDTPALIRDNLRQLDRLANVGMLSASMIHEIKNALVAGKTFFDLLLEKHQDAELVDIVRREMARIDAIVSQMLKFASPTQASQTVVHVHQVLDHSLRLIQPQIEAKAIALDRSFAADSDLVTGDDHQLQQAFVNLLMNALEATQPRGALSVATELIARPALAGSSKTAQLQVTIQDSGTGISPEHMGRLFEPFFTTKSHGTGLGLPITHRIIKEHRGTIRVDSEPNKGATFCVLLPAFSPR